MAIARWKDLCIDASDARRIGGFWGGLLGLSVTVDDDGDACLRGERSEETIWINTVPEPRTVKQRVHLDIEAASVDDVLARGATMVLPAAESGFAWSVVTDPEGGELCVFERHPFPADPAARLHEVVVDTETEVTAEAQARWWADVLGGTVGGPPDGRYAWVEDIPGAGFDGFAFVPVPEAKSVKNRIHWDVTTDDLDGLLSRGATILATPTESTPWHVVADQAQNEFCAFPEP